MIIQFCARVLWLLSSFKLSDSALLAAGKVEQCINEGPESELDCDTKVVVTLTLANDQGEVESVSTSVLTEIEDTDGVTRTLSEPWSITLSKSDVFIRYPLQYIQTFHAKPTEVVIETTPSVFGFGGCIDDPDPSSNPTCEFAREETSGHIITDSQGFCCSCSTIGVETIRGLDGTCSLLGSDAETAHCLSFDEDGDRWYSAYSMLEHETFFTILITVYRGSGDGMVQETIALSPSNTQGTSEDGNLVVRLLGDLVSYTSPMSMDNEYFFIPSEPADDPRVINWVSNAMIIDKNAVTLDGRECDKIGVSYSAFRSQANECEKQQGECLNNQLEDYHQNGDHFARDLVDDILMQEDDGLIYFSYVEHITQQSLVTLTISTDEISFVINRAAGHLEFCQIANFESLTTSGALSCYVQNDGYVEAMFRVAVLDCSNGILPINDIQRTIEPNATQLFTFEVHSSNPVDSTHSCNVFLFDSLAVEIDEQEIEFTTTETIEDRGAQDGNSENTGSSSTGTAAQYSCASYCDSWIDIPCFVIKGCWSAIGKVIGTVVASLIIICTSPRWIRWIIGFFKSLNRSSDECGSEHRVSKSPSRSRSKRHRKRRDKHKKEIIESSANDITMEFTDHDEDTEDTEYTESDGNIRCNSSSERSRSRGRRRKKKKKRHRETPSRRRKQQNEKRYYHSEPEPDRSPKRRKRKDRKKRKRQSPRD